MAGEQTTSIRDCSEENTLFLRRFIYDVLLYTLRLCSFPEPGLPKTELAVNVYPDLELDILRIAGASVLRTALVMRDKWLQMFISRHNSHGFTNDDIPDFLESIVKICPQNRENSTQSTIQLYLASSSEIMMYFDLRGVKVDLHLLTQSISEYVCGMMAMNKDGCETIGDLFDSLDDVEEYTFWLIDCITKFAIPYGHRNDVSDLFFKRVRERFQDQVVELVDKHRFLPPDLFVILSGKDSEDSPQPTSAPKVSESPGPSKLPTGAEAHVSKRKSRKPTKSEKVPEHSGHSSKILSAPGIEQDMDKMCLGAEGTSQETHGAKPRHKTTQNVDIRSCPFFAKFSGGQS